MERKKDRQEFTKGTGKRDLAGVAARGRAIEVRVGASERMQPKE